MGRIVKITDSTGECIEIHYDDDGNIIRKNISQQLGSNNKLSNTRPSESDVKSVNVKEVSHIDASVNDSETDRNKIIADKMQKSDHKTSQNIDETVNDQHTAENYKEQYENFRKTHPTFSKSPSSAFTDIEGNSNLGRYGIIIIAILSVIILATGIIYKCNNSNDTSNPNSSSMSKNESLQSRNNESNSSQKQSQESQESPGESVIKPTMTNIFKLNLEQPPPPDCKVKLLNPIVILPNGDQVSATIFKTKVDGKELTGWTVDSYPLGSRFSCSATCE